MVSKDLALATSRPLQWTSTTNALRPYQASVDQAHWQLQVNDFPAEALYTLIINQQPIGDLEDWPAAWTRP